VQTKAPLALVLGVRGSGPKVGGAASFKRECGVSLHLQQKPVSISGRWGRYPPFCSDEPATREHPHLLFYTSSDGPTCSTNKSSVKLAWSWVVVAPSWVKKSIKQSSEVLGKMPGPASSPLEGSPIKGRQQASQPGRAVQAGNLPRT